MTLLSYTDNEAIGDKWNTTEFEYYRNLYAPSRNEYIVTEASRAPKNYLRLVLYLTLKQSLNFMNQSQKKLSKWIWLFLFYFWSWCCCRYHEDKTEGRRFEWKMFSFEKLSRQIQNCPVKFSQIVTYYGLILMHLNFRGSCLISDNLKTSKVLYYWSTRWITPFRYTKT